MAKEPLSPKYNDVVGQKAAINTTSPLGDAPTPDMPYTSSTTDYADPGHVNPAIEPAPIWEPAERPAPVPVINDPGLLGGNPSLQELNAANLKATLGDDAPDADQTSGITADNHLAEIKRVATERLAKLREVQSTAATDARTGVAPRAHAQTGSKFGSASTKA